MLTQSEVWEGRSGCFGPIRALVGVPDLGSRKVLLHLRDPRDVLVSMFYSYCYTHPGDVAGNTGYRKEVADQGIDRFVLTKARETESTYRGDYGTGGSVHSLIGNMRERYERYFERFAEVLPFFVNSNTKKCG